MPMRIALILLATMIGLRAEKPNLVLILADDLGWGEVGCFGQEKIKTPNLDKLASHGVRLTRHYCGAPVCAPSRCVLMTGQDLSRAEIRDNADSGNGKPFPGQWPMTEEAVTLAEVLQKAGYRTGGFGKWGLGPTDSEGSPLKQGFTRFYGYNCQRNAHSYYPPFLDDDNGIEQINDNPIPGHAQKKNGEVKAADYQAEVYGPDRILEEALEFLDNDGEKPFFLFCPFVEPHVSMHPPTEWVERYPKEWDEEKGPYRGQNGYVPHPRPRAGYAAMISDLDEHVGAIMAKLEVLGKLENTLIVFSSDNGTTHGGGDPAFHVGGVDAEFFNSTRGLRGYKGSVYEGGIRVPTIVSWKGQLPEGKICEVPSYFPDWFSTFCQAANASVPEDVDGINLLPALKGQDVERRKPMVWEFHGYGGQIAVIDGDWKAVLTGFNTQKHARWVLYNLANDPAEKTDLSEKEAKRLQGLVDYWKSHRRDNERYSIRPKLLETTRN